MLFEQVSLLFHFEFLEILFVVLRALLLCFGLLLLVFQFFYVFRLTGLVGDLV